MKLLIDMNLSPRWATLLEKAGFSAVHWSSVGSATAKDAEIMSYASAHGYVVLTHDLDFSAILAATQASTPSVVQIRAEDVNPEEIGLKVIFALHQTEADLEAGVLLTVDTQRSRLRLLPLGEKGPETGS